jgi:CheY-like chemotaxis protein
MALADPPDLILLDIALPGMDGLAVAARLKEHERARAIPIIALTARAMKGDREEILGAGCDDYLCKPLDPGELREKIGKWLAGATAGEEV